LALVNICRQRTTNNEQSVIPLTFATSPLTGRGEGLVRAVSCVGYYQAWQDKPINPFEQAGGVPQGE
jgi:hypothetical protein